MSLISFQFDVNRWMQQCFGSEVSNDAKERNDRFLEEALELVQTGKGTAEEAHQLVDYVFGRPVGEMNQEVGGVMVTLAALCTAHGVDMHRQGAIELQRIWDKIPQIRAKHAAKPKFGPLPIDGPLKQTAWAIINPVRGTIETSELFARDVDALSNCVTEQQCPARVEWNLQTESRDKPDIQPINPAIGSRWLHAKSGGTYVVMGACLLEGQEGEPAVLYRSEDEHRPAGIWARATAEFLDGRFIQMEAGA